MSEDDENIQINKKRKSDDLDSGTTGNGVSQNGTDESDNDLIFKGSNLKNVKKKNKIDDDGDEDMNKSLDYEEDEDYEEDQNNNSMNSNSSNGRKSKSVRLKSSSKSALSKSTQDTEDENDEDNEDDEDDEDYEDEESIEDIDSKPNKRNQSKKQQHIKKKPKNTSGVGSKSSPKETKSSGSKKSSIVSRSSSLINEPIPPPSAEETKPNTVQYHCDYCQKDISGVVRIRCAVCQDFDLCLECFSVGVEITPHKNHHDYTVVDNMAFPMFTQDWGADEELLLLEAIELYGLGNWNDVSDNVGTKSAQECKSHYFTYYLNTTTSPLPDTSKVLTTKETVHFQRAVPSVNSNPNDRFTKDKSKSKTGNKSVSSSDHQDGPSGPVTDSVGFMKNRGHFEVEYDNDAELVVKDLTFDQDDTPSDREVKSNLLESYSQRLDERIRRRDFIVNKGLLDYKRLERKRFKDDKDILNSLKIFLQVTNKEDFENLVNGTIEEKNLKQKILQLQMYRENGLRYLSDGLVFEEEKRKRDTERSQRRSKSELSYLSYQDKQSSGVSGGGSGLIGSGGVKSQKHQLKEKESLFLGIPIPEAPNKNITGLVGVDRKTQKHPKTKGNYQAEMEGLSNVDVLSIREKQLCYTLRLLPQQYLLVKEAFLSESLKNNGILKQSTALKLSQLHPTQIQKLYEYFEQNNFIKK